MMEFLRKCVAFASAAIACFMSSIEPTDALTIDYQGDGSFNTPNRKGYTKFSIYQCEAFTFDWSGGGDHNVHELFDKESFRGCDFSNAVELAPRAMEGIFTLAGDDTLQVTRRYFSSDVSSNCEMDNMKASLRIIPIMEKVGEGFECAGGEIDGVTTKNTLKRCRNSCKRRRAGNCVGIQYDRETNQCSTYIKIPTGLGSGNSNMTCERAASACPNPEQELYSNNLKWSKWKSNRNIHTSYEVETKRTCNCFYDVSGPVIIRVVAGEVESKTWKSSRKKVPEHIAPYFLTLDQQIEKIQKAIESNADQISIQYDEKYGFPSDVYIDYVEGLSDEDLIFSNLNYTSLA